MPLCRLLVLVMFFALCAGLVQAQSQHPSSSLAVLRPTTSMNSNAGADQPKAGPGSQIASSQLDEANNALLAKAGDEWQGSHHGTPSFPLSPESDRTCYFIRDYVVIRDSSHSDSVHRDGSFTCVPGSRFRVYTTGR